MTKIYNFSAGPAVLDQSVLDATAIAAREFNSCNQNKVNDFIKVVCVRYKFWPFHLDYCDNSKHLPDKDSLFVYLIFLL